MKKGSATTGVSSPEFLPPTASSAKTFSYSRQERPSRPVNAYQLFKGRLLPHVDGREDSDFEASLAEYVKKPFPIRFLYKRKTHWARVRKDGRIRFKGKLYTSPSMPASRICGGRAANGWMCWQYERAPSDWVPLDTLRN